MTEHSSVYIWHIVSFTQNGIHKIVIKQITVTDSVAIQARKITEMMRSRRDGLNIAILVSVAMT